MNNKLNSGIIFSCFTRKNKSGEQFFMHHILCYVISGKIETFNGTVHHTFGAGEVFLYKRNTLGKFAKCPAHGQPYKSISFVLEREFLMHLNEKNDKVLNYHELKECVYPINSNILLKNFFNSLLPWFDEPLPEQLADLKKKEAILLLLKLSPRLSDVLFDYSDPGKIDLEAFMNQNYRFNVGLPQFAYLTGRSLATFKRDFEKTFHTSPHRWIRVRRLEEGYYLIAEKKEKPNDIYAELGFETLAHFSYAFKKHFKVNPSEVNN